MTVLLAIEAKQPDGTTYRAVFGWKFHSMTSWLIVFGRLF